MGDTDTRNTCGNERYWHTEYVQQWAILTHGTRAAMSDTDTRNTCGNERYWHTEHVQPTEKERLLAIYLLQPPRAQNFPTSCGDLFPLKWREEEEEKKQIDSASFFFFFFFKGFPIVKDVGVASAETYMCTIHMALLQSGFMWSCPSPLPSLFVAAFVSHVLRQWKRKRTYRDRV